jgi:hypothetical protein
MLKYFQIFIYFILFSTRAKNTSHCNTSSMSLVLNSANHSLMRSLRKVSGSAEGLGGVGEQEGWKCIVGKSVMVVVRV